MATGPAGADAGLRVDLLARTMVDLADTLTLSWDPLDFLHLLSVRARGILGAEGAVVRVEADTELRLLAASSETARLVQLFSEDVDEGPGVDAWRTGEPVIATDLSTLEERWPRFAPAAVQHDYRSALGAPMLLRDQRLGALLMLYSAPRTFDETHVAVAQSLAEVATIGLVLGRRFQRSEEVAAELQWALHSRVLIEQAKGALAERLGIPSDEAFELMRREARGAGLPLRDAAARVLEGHTPARSSHETPDPG